MEEDIVFFHLVLAAVSENDGKYALYLKPLDEEYSMNAKQAKIITD